MRAHPATSQELQLVQKLNTKVHFPSPKDIKPLLKHELQQRDKKKHRGFKLSQYLQWEELPRVLGAKTACHFT